MNALPVTAVATLLPLVPTLQAVAHVATVLQVSWRAMALRLVSASMNVPLTMVVARPIRWCAARMCAVRSRVVLVLQVTPVTAVRALTTMSVLAIMVVVVVLVPTLPALTFVAPAPARGIRWLETLALAL
jgi:hypothetical protein